MRLFEVPTLDYLVVRRTGGSHQRFEMTRPMVRIGRARRNDLILDDPHASSYHAEIAGRSGGWWLRDLGALNGTILNGCRIQEETPLSAGDRITIARTEIVFNGSLPSPIVMTDGMPQGSDPFVLSGEEIRTPQLEAFVRVPSSHPLSRERAARPHVPSVPSPPPSPQAAIAPLSPSALRVILDADRELAYQRPLAELLERIMDLVEHERPFDRGLLMLLKKGTLVPIVVRVPAGEAGAAVEISRTITDRVVRSKESVLIADALIDHRTREQRSIQRRGLRSIMCVPLWTRQEVIGLIYLDSAREAGQFTEEDLVVLTHLAVVAAVKIEQHHLFERVVAARALEEDLRKAAEIQQRLLPAAAPALPGYSLGGESVPCRAVGGDTYDFIPLDGGRLGVGLGDAAGKGLPAALLMCGFQSSLRALCAPGMTSVEIVSRLNRLISVQIPANRFVTFFFAILDPGRHTLTYVNAGHDPPFVIRAGGVASELTATGAPVGISDDSVYFAETFAFEPGDLFVAYSDGVPDARNRSGEMFGRERLVEAARATGDTPAVESLRSIQTAVAHFTAGSPADEEDDVTIVVLRRDR